MQFVKVFDNQRKCIVKLILNTDNKISYDYFKQIFPDAVGLLEMNEEAYIGSVEKKNKKKILNRNFF